VADDAAMGWARYAHSMRVFVFNSGLFYIRPTPAALDLLDRIALRLAAENGWDQAIFNEVRCKLLRPAARRHGPPCSAPESTGRCKRARSRVTRARAPRRLMRWTAAHRARPLTGRPQAVHELEGA